MYSQLFMQLYSSFHCLDGAAVGSRFSWIIGTSFGVPFGSCGCLAYVGPVSIDYSNIIQYRWIFPSIRMIPTSDFGFSDVFIHFNVDVLLPGLSLDLIHGPHSFGNS